jgi:hypothetical protein
MHKVSFPGFAIASPFIVDGESIAWEQNAGKAILK